MREAVVNFVGRLNSESLLSSGVLDWAAPIPAFGNVSNAHVATVGINPSSLEFTDVAGIELEGHRRRFETLNSLGLESWQDVNASDVEKIVESCEGYFSNNPYDAWFGRLEQVIGRAGFSFYGRSSRACHLDLIPYATSPKWGKLTRRQQVTLLEVARDCLAFVLHRSDVRVLILNGRTVINWFEKMSGTRLSSQTMRDWKLNRANDDGVEGFAFKSSVESLAGIPLGRTVRIIGYNHNLQSSFGVTKAVTAAIGCWIAAEISQEF